MNTAQPQTAARELLHVGLDVGSGQLVARNLQCPGDSRSATDRGLVDHVTAEHLGDDRLRVERWAGQRDRRQSMVRLTPRGRRVLADIQQRAERHVTRTLAPLAPSERAQLTAALRVLTGVLSVPGDDRYAPRAIRP